MEREIKFSENLRKLRESRGMYQKDLAADLDIKQSSLSSYENGSRFPEAMTLIKIANYFNVTLDELLYNLEIEVNRVLDDNQALFLDLENGMSFDDLVKKYNFVVDGEELEVEAKKRILEMIEFEYYKMKRV